MRIPRSLRFLLFQFGLFWLVLAPALEAQNQPHLGYVFPAGGQQGTTFLVTVAGQFLNGATNVYLTGDGVSATIQSYNRPLLPRELNDVREQLRELQARRFGTNVLGPRSTNRIERAGGLATNAAPAGWTGAEARLALELRQKLADSLRRQANPAIAEWVTLQVTLAPDASSGQRELRMGAALGLSNPMSFQVSQWPEFTKRPGGQVIGLPEILRTNAVYDQTVSVPVVLNGQMPPGGVDRYRFHARRGQRLVVAVSARELIPYLSDAVPGWFQAAVSLFDPRGREVAYADHFYFHPDPVFDYEIRDDGQYRLEIHDSIYRGRDDFVYRIRLGELPWLTGIFPLGLRAGTKATIELRGWNLPVATLTFDATEKGPGVYPLEAISDGKFSNPQVVAVDDLPECLEQEPNDQPAQAQPVTLPIIINGRVDRPGDQDVFRFEGRAGSQVVAEVQARRLNSPLDSVLELTDGDGRRLAFNDDHEDRGAGLLTHHADSWLMATLPADGAYYIRLGDAQHQGGPEFSYRLRLSAPRPDFALRVLPASINGRVGAIVPLTVHAVRKDGFDGEIKLAFSNAPAGFALSGGRIPAGCDQVRCTLSMPLSPRREPVSLLLEGRALIGGQPVVRAAQPAEDMMQAFFYHHFVPAQDLKVVVAGQAVRMALSRVLSDLPLQIPAGGAAGVRLTLPPYAAAAPLQLELSEPPEGIAIQQVSPSPRGTEIVVAADRAKVKAGLKGNLIIEAFGERPAGRANARANRARFALGTLPAVPFEVTPYVSPP